MRIPAEALQKIYQRVDRSGQCWLWTGYRNNYGYACMRFAGGQYLVHRLTYQAIVQPIDGSLTLDHLCRVRHCVNPEHLEPVPGAVNTLRGVSFSAVNARKTHCPAGHEYTPENTYYNPSNARVCLTCKRARGRLAAARRRAVA